MGSSENTEISDLFGKTEELSVRYVLDEKKLVRRQPLPMRPLE